MLIAELNRTRRLGCEYEMTVPRIGTGGGAEVQAMLAHVLRTNGIPAISRPYSHEPVPAGNDVAVESDSSVEGESRWAGIHWAPVEIKTRILTYDEWESIVPRVLAICEYMGARVNASCSNHVHLGFDEASADIRNIRSLWNLTHRYNNVLLGLVPPSRRQNHYCRPMPPAAKILHGANSRRAMQRLLARYDRYQLLNLTHIWDANPRIEIRLHSGTLDEHKARHWLRFCLQFLQHAVTRSCQAAEHPLVNDRKGIEALLVSIGLKVNTKVYSRVSPELRETGKYLLRRWKHFNGPSPLLPKSPKPQAEVIETCVA